MGSNQQFSLRWNNYLQHITHVFDSLRDDENLVDVTLCCEGKKIRAHKMLLSACSSYFREIFKDNPCQHPIIIFRNVKYEDLEGLISFMYKGEVNVEQESLSSFLSTAELLEVNGLTGGTNSCFPDTVVDDDAPGSAGASSAVGGTGGNRSKHSTKPDSPMNRKRSGHESPPMTQDNIKTEPLDYHEQDGDDYGGNGGGGGGGDEDSTIKYEPEVSWNNEDHTADGANELGNTAGTSNNGNLPDSLQVFAHGLWRRLHPSLKRFGCDECGKVFKHPRSLDHHKKMHEGRTTCPFCRRVFGRMYALRLHMSSSHPGQPMLQSTKSH